MHFLYALKCLSIITGIGEKKHGGGGVVNLGISLAWLELHGRFWQIPQKTFHFPEVWHACSIHNIHYNSFTMKYSRIKYIYTTSPRHSPRATYCRCGGRRFLFLNSSIFVFTGLNWRRTQQNLLPRS